MEDSYEAAIRAPLGQIDKHALSPTKSSSTSEEEGQIEEADAANSKGGQGGQGVAAAAAATSIMASRHNSPRGSSAVHDGKTAMDRSPSASWRQGSSSHAEHPSSSSSNSWRPELAEHTYKGRSRGYEGSELAAGSPRWSGSYREERRPTYDEYARVREPSQVYDRYDASSRSMSIPTFDERYRDRPPSRGHFDDRERDSAWPRSRYNRLSSPSPSHLSSATQARNSWSASGSMSGPTSPTTSRRERWSSGLGRAPSWERERLDREREYWRARDAAEMRVDGYGRRLPGNRSSPPRGSRESRDMPEAEEWSRPGQWRSRNSTSNVVQSHSSPSPSVGRSSDVQSKSTDGDANRESRPASRMSSMAPHEREGATADTSTGPVGAVAELHQQGGATEPAVIKMEEQEEQEEPEEGAGPEQRGRGQDEEDDGSRDARQAASPQLQKSSAEDEANVASSALLPLSFDPVVKSPAEATFHHSEAEAEQDVKDTKASLSSSVPMDDTAEAIGRPEVESSLKVPVELTEAVQVDVDVRMSSPNGERELKVVEEQKKVELDDGADFATREDEQLEGGEALDAPLPLHLGEDTHDGVTEEDAATPTTPLPTKEEQNQMRQASMRRLLRQHTLSSSQLSKVFYDNKKVLGEGHLKPLESAIHGELPRKYHVEPWLDGDDDDLQASGCKVMRLALARQKRLHDKIETLRGRYKRLNKEWHRHCSRLDRWNEAREGQGRSHLHPTNSGSATSLLPHGTGTGVSGQSGAFAGGTSVEDTNISLMAAMGPSMTRANRRNTQTGFAGFGDAVRSEAEFLEILASLESADMQDPNMRAARTTATEPEMIINPDSNSPLLSDYDDDNGFVADPVAFYLSDFDPDYWSEEEKTTFERRYALFPKQFGKIAASLPHKTAKQCVSYYYLTKHAGFDYKTLTAARNRDRKRKSRVKPKKGRGSALMADLKGDEVEEEDQQSPIDGSMMAEGVSLVNARRPMGPSRARILTTGALSNGDLAMVAEEEEGEGAALDGMGGRKRRVDEMDGDEKKARPGKGAKRSKSEKRARVGAGVAETPGEELAGSLVAAATALHGDHDLAAAEALGALAGGAVSGDTPAPGDPASVGNAAKRSNKKAARLATAPMANAAVTPSIEGGGEEGSKRSRQTTSSYWSVAERNEFLRSLATWGKDWDAISSTLSTKSAAQARNYFARNTDESEFVEAARMAIEHARLPLHERQHLALAFIQNKALLVNEKGQPMGLAPASGYFPPMPLAQSGGEDAGAVPPRGLNINSLLNEDTPSSAGLARRASLNEWFGKEDGGDDSNDDTEDEEQGREPNEYAEEVDPAHLQPDSAGGHPPSLVPRYPIHHHHRRSPSILSSMPPPSAFIHTSRYQLPGQPRVSSGNGEDRRSPLSGFHHANLLTRPGHSPSEPGPYYSQERLGHEGRESDGRQAWTPAAQQQQRHASWPSAYSPSHLAPPPPAPSLSPGARPDLSPSSRSPYPPRPATSSGVGHLSYHLPHSTSSSRSPYERPHSSGHMSTTSIRSLSPHPPPPQLPPMNPSLFSQRRDHSDSSQ